MSVEWADVALGGLEPVALLFVEVCVQKKNLPDDVWEVQVQTKFKSELKTDF